MRHTATNLAVILFMLFAAVGSRAQSTLYWTEHSEHRIQRLTLDGSPVQTIVEGPLAYPRDMILDIVGRDLYWSNTGRDEIVGIHEDGSDLRVIQPGRLVAIDTDSRHMYVVVDTTLFRTNLDGSDKVSVLDLPEYQGGPVALDLKNEKVYWPYWEPPKRYSASWIRRANMDGTNLEDVFDNKVKRILFVGLTVDTVGSRLYMYDGWGPHNLSSVRTDGSDYRREDHHRDVHGLAVHPTTEKLYWVAGSDSGGVYRSNMDGTDVENVYTFDDPPTGMALDPLHNQLYWGTSFGIWRSEINGPYVEAGQPILETDIRWLHGIDLDATAGKLYWTNGRALGRCDLDGRNVTTIASGTGEQIEDVVVDPQRGFIYWSQTLSIGEAASNILRARLDGSNMETVVALPNSYGGPLALNVESDQLYWTSRDGIFVSDSDGSNRTQLFEKDYEDGPLYVTDLALDVQNGRIFWSRSRNGTPSLAWTNLDGSGSVTGAGFSSDDPTGRIVVDPEGTFLYWADVRYEGGSGRGSIWRMALQDAAPSELVADGLGYVGSLTLKWEPPATISEHAALPGAYVLSQNYPNPFNPSTTIRYSIGSSGRVRIKVLDILGRLVAVLVDEIQPAGSDEVEWTAGSTLPSGTYFYTLETREGTMTRSMTLIK